MNTITIDADLQTEGLWQEVVKTLDDDVLDQLSVDRKHAPGEGSANEPVTLAVTLGIPTIALCVVISRAISQALEAWRQDRHMDKVIFVAQVAPEAVAEVRALAQTHAGVVVNMKEITAKDLTGT